MRGSWGAVALVASLCAYGLVLGHIRATGQRLRAGNSEGPWWFGYARDVSNLLALVAVTVSFWGVGFPPPLALAAAFLLVLFVYVLDYWLGRGLRRAMAGWLAAAAGVGVAAIVLMQPARVAAELAALLHRLFT
jgi:hypothetical protein